MHCFTYRHLLRPTYQLLACALLLTACGSGSSTSNAQNNLTGTSDTTTTALAPIPARITNTRGALLDGTLVKTNTVQESTAAISNPTAKAPAVIPVYDVKQYRVTYQTLDGDGKLSTASGIIAVPQKPTGAKSPLLSFQHGTVFHNIEAPSNDTVATSPVNIIASLGFVVIAADYIGYGASQGKDHPYLQKDPSAVAVTDFIVAARQWLAEQRQPLNDQLFLTGYSEGGYVTLAAQQALEAAGTPITASVAGAGPYDLQYTLDELLNTKAILSAAGGALGLSRPDLAAKYPGKVDEATVDLLMYILIPKESDIKFSKTFLMDWMANDYPTMKNNSLYDWQAKTPTRLTHGRDDDTVPFGNSTRALDGMRAKGTSNIELDECFAIPADHTGCIKPYAQVMTQYFSTFAKDL
ncbi:alpha/beta hydrolase family protein [Thiothrix lacustris]|uniref:alpha/beta hydrolase family protein n=1 Tax=Thiothrix lacustris TaxID=525917 RepID=UPI0027E5A9FA|nr:prolyl oligopeptidase family serine peptidase [Thiothrix lacustris]WMP18923.1 prolyl oligopeptidase family serine peptidase [Thiothrix lacustris]